MGEIFECLCVILDPRCFLKCVECPGECFSGLTSCLADCFKDDICKCLGECCSDVFKNLACCFRCYCFTLNRCNLFSVCKCFESVFCKTLDANCLSACSFYTHIGDCSRWFQHNTSGIGNCIENCCLNCFFWPRSCLITTGYYQRSSNKFQSSSPAHKKINYKTNEVKSNDGGSELNQHRIDNQIFYLESEIITPERKVKSSNSDSENSINYCKKTKELDHPDDNPKVIDEIDKDESISKYDSEKESNHLDFKEEVVNEDHFDEKKFYNK
jgi:hypothetical protein